MFVMHPHKVSGIRSLLKKRVSIHTGLDLRIFSGLFRDSRVVTDRKSEKCLFFTFDSISTFDGTIHNFFRTWFCVCVCVWDSHL